MSSSPIHAPDLVLVVATDDATRDLIRRWLAGAGFATEGLSSSGELLTSLGLVTPSAAIVDAQIFLSDPINSAAHLAARHHGLSVLTFHDRLAANSDTQSLSFPDVTLSAEAMVTAVQAAVRGGNLSRQLDNLRRESKRIAYTNLLGCSDAIRHVYQSIDQLQERQMTILITGEQGSGKQHLAQTIHEVSERRDYPFVTFDCSRTSEEMHISELFGQCTGAFGPKTLPRTGRLEQAEGGTLFLKEITALSPTAQRRLLAVIDDRKISRVGETRPWTSDVRIIASTSVELVEAVRKNAFSDSLFFRLAHFEVDMPALRERGSDIALLAEHFAREAVERHQLSDVSISPAVLDLLCQYSWKRNVSELKLAIERAVIVSSKDTIQPEDLPIQISKAGWTYTRVVQSKSEEFPLADNVVPFPHPSPGTLQREVILAALKETQGSVTAAVRLLGIPRAAFYQHLAHLGIS